MNDWIVVAVAGAGSFAFRLSIVALMDHVDTPAPIERLASYVVPAAFAGMAAVALVGPLREGGANALAPGVAVVVTAGIAHRHPVHLAFLGGLAALWITTVLTTLA
jgi:branched-subunit amino acid transport protein